MEKEPAERTSLKRLIELVDKDFADRWHLVRSGRFCLFFLGYCIVLGIPVVLMFQVFFYVTDRQLGVAVIGVAIAFLAIGVSFLTIFVSSGAFERILREDWFARTCRSDEFKRMNIARNRLLAWALISMRDRIHPSTLAEAMEGAPTLLQDEILLRDALLRE